MKEKIIQFGEGGFLRGFVDWMLQQVNEQTDFGGKVVVVQPIAQGMCDALTAQNCTYTHVCRGVEGVDTRKIDVIARCVKPYDDFDAYLALAENKDFRFVVSNTTEAGICFSDADKSTDRPANTFPGKLTQLLKRRCDLGLPGFVFLPCELNDRNGDLLKKSLLQYADLWDLGDGYKTWLEQENIFCCTLVDRINTGFPKGEDLGVDDPMLNASEYFHLWVIEGYADLCKELPLDKCGLNVIVTDELERYRTRKVRILNGAHTSTVAYSMLSGLETVKDSMEDEKMSAFLKHCVFDEIIPTLDLPKEELVDYANNVLKRFANPYIKHYWSSIALNSVSKFKVRVLPSILTYRERFGKYPENLMLAFAKLLEFYKTDMTNDDAEVTAFLKTATVGEALSNASLWGQDLSNMESEIVKYADQSER